MIKGFDPNFDDAVWTLDWLQWPLVQVPPGDYEHGYRVVREFMYDFEVFGQRYNLDAPLDVRALLAPSGVLWMSDVPQERMMMYHNGQQARGHVLVGGAGLGLFPQYAAGARSFTIVENSPVVARLVAPVLKEIMDQRGVEIRFVLGDIGTYLRKAEPERYDTIFLDTWHLIDAALLPTLNSLREAARRHLARDGAILLWGYRWMVRLFEEASATLLAIPPGERETWLAEQLVGAPRAATLLQPVAETFRGVTVQRWELDAAVAECREWVVNFVDEAK